MISRSEIIETLRKVKDPELMINIVDLGLVYRVEVVHNKVEIDYTLTSPGCPLSEVIENDIASELGKVTDLWIKPRLVWEPRWQPDYMSDDAKVALGYPI